MYQYNKRGRSFGRDFVGCASIVALGAGAALLSTDPVHSQPAAPAGGAFAAPGVQGGQLRRDQVVAIARVLGEAESHGLSPSEYGSVELDRLLNSADPGERARGEAVLRRNIIAYAKAQRGGRIPTSAFADDWSVQPGPYDAERDLNFALSQDRLDAWLATLAPPFERYRQLRTALGQYRQIAARGGWPTIGAGPPLKPGMSDPRVVALRQRIAAENPPGAIATSSPLYDPSLAAAVASAQSRYGLPSDGVVGASTLAAFNRPVEARIAQIAANMERWRWMPRATPRDRIEVNIASQMLDLYRGGVKLTSMRAAVGTPKTKTPMLTSTIHSVVLNPPWNVPSSIASQELLPKGRAYLARNNYRFVSDGAGGSRLQQRPGPGNSLGRIKFDFQNRFGVYLHDTSARNVFERDARSVSHGCVRVERPEELAALLLEDDPQWNNGRIDQVLANTDTVRAPTPQGMTVMLLYWTVFRDDTGQVNFRNDIYGWDDELANLINRGRISA